MLCFNVGLLEQPESPLACREGSRQAVPKPTSTQDGESEMELQLYPVVATGVHSQN